MQAAVSVVAFLFPLALFAAGPANELCHLVWLIGKSNDEAPLLTDDSLGSKNSELGPRGGHPIFFNLNAETQHLFLSIPITLV